MNYQPEIMSWAQLQDVFTTQSFATSSAANAAQFETSTSKSNKDGTNDKTNTARQYRDVNEAVNDGLLWQAGQGAEKLNIISTGIEVMDACLPVHGWPKGGISEIFSADGMQGMPLLLPSMARQSQGDKWVIWVGPPMKPHAPSLVAHDIDLSHVLMAHPKSMADYLWVLEQALRSGHCSMVIGWVDGMTSHISRRLEMAAKEGNTTGILFRPRRYRHDISSASMRLDTTPIANGVRVEMMRCRKAAPIASSLYFQINDEQLNDHRFSA